MLATRYPRLANIGHKAITQYWQLKSHWVDYEFPKGSGAATLSEAVVKQYNRQRPFGPKRRICYAPFNNLHFTLNGNVVLCSFNGDHPVGHIEESTIEEIWFGEKAVEFRKQMASYNLDKCMNCQQVLERGNIPAFPPAKYDLHADDESVYPTQMSFEMSNLCNLECVMCSGEFSSSIQSNREKVPVSKYRYPENFIDQLDAFIPHLKIATFIGGEPTMIKAYYEIWEAIVSRNPNCVIHVQTNATRLPEKFRKLLESGQFDVGVSIDAITPEVYESIRVNANYKEVMQNIEFLCGLHRQGKVYLNFNFCPIATNWRELPGMVQFANQRNVILKILNVDGPNHLALRYRDAAFLSQVYESLSRHQPATSGGINVKRNEQALKSYVQSLPKLIQLAQQRQQSLNILENQSLDELKQLLWKEVSNNALYWHYAVNERQSFFQHCIGFLEKESKDELIFKHVLAQIIHIHQTTNGDKNSGKGIDAIFTDFKSLATGFMVLKLSDNGL
ncbi:MAG: radical SAM protein [Chitinophagales bacterium]